MTNNFHDLTTRNLFISLCSHMSYMQGQLEALHQLDDPDGHYWYRESVALRQKVADHLAALADEPAVPEVVGSEWQPCVKLPITVHVREQRPGEQHVSTREGITPVQSDDLIMLGVAGEEYPIGRELFQRTYRMGSADEPAVPESREPASVVGQPSDGEMARCLADSLRAFKLTQDLADYPADHWSRRAADLLERQALAPEVSE